MTPAVALRVSLAILGLGFLASCAAPQMAETPVSLGAFGLGHNIAVADDAKRLTLSRGATSEELETAMKAAIKDRFGADRYQGDRLYNIGILVDAYALAPPGIPLIASPKSVLVVTANIWDDGKRQKLNAEGMQLTVFEGVSGQTLLGSGLTRSKEDQLKILTFNAAAKVEAWLLEHPEWFAPEVETPEPKAVPAP